MCCLAVSESWNSVHREHKERIYGSIDTNDCYNFILDEASCRYDDFNVTCLLYDVDPRETPKTLELYCRDAPADAEAMYDLLMIGERTGNLERDLCSSIGCDSASYMRTLAISIKPHFRYAVMIFDTPHRLNNAVKKALNHEYGIQMRLAVIGIRAPFSKSHANRFNFKRYLRQNYFPVCSDCKLFD